MKALKNNKIETRSFTTETLSPKKYLEIHDKKRSSIKDVKFIRPKLGDNHFGKFQITFKHKIFKPIGEEK